MMTVRLPPLSLRVRTGNPDGILATGWTNIRRLCIHPLIRPVRLRAPTGCRHTLSPSCFSPVAEALPLRAVVGQERAREDNGDPDHF